MILSQKSCLACQGLESKLTKPEISKFLKLVNRWKLSKSGEYIVKEFKFKDFRPF